MNKLVQWIDKTVDASSRAIASRSSRRGFLGRLGGYIVGASALPLLPVARAQAAEGLAEMGDPQSCDYWRYCALGGTLCTCCGGSISSCPPGAEVSPISWVGTCRNPVDGKDYLISYNDCCGKAVCARCFCHRAERDMPVYFPSKANDILWCFGTESQAYHCTVAAVIGEATAS
ncbi:MAG: methylamine dehydrogenase light chain [Pseudomonadales bacterium]|nr:methylamine dehydrogenase light chain [Pseudomonadales bacterium]